MNNTIEKKFELEFNSKWDGDASLFYSVKNWLKEQSSLSQPPVIDTKELSKKYYEAIGRGDLQNETDMIDVDAVWNWFLPYLYTGMPDLKSEDLISFLKSEISSLTSKLSELTEDYEMTRKSRNTCYQTISDMNAKLSDAEKEISQLNTSLFASERFRIEDAGSAIDEANRLRAKLSDMEKANEWVSVEDRLPEINGDYLVCKGNKIVAKDYFDPLSSMWADGFNITHWMPLPSPPKPKTT